MNRLKSITSAFLFLSLLVCSCSEEEVNVKEKLTGNWDVEEIDSIMVASGNIAVHKTTFELRLTAQDSAFKTYFRYIGNQKEYYGTDSSTYSINNNGNVIEFISRQPTQSIQFPFIYLLTEFQITIVNDKSMLFKSKSGNLNPQAINKTQWELVKI